MAKLVDFVDLLADITDVPRTQVNHVARIVREAGLIQTGGRGLGGATMAPSDAAALLVGLLLNATTPDRVAGLRNLLEAPLVSVRPGAHSSIAAFSRSPSRPETGYFDTSTSLVASLAHLLGCASSDAATPRELGRALGFQHQPATLLGLDVLQSAHGSQAAIAILDDTGCPSTLRFGPPQHEPGGMITITSLCADLLAAISRRLTDR